MIVKKVNSQDSKELFGVQINKRTVEVSGITGKEEEERRKWNEVHATRTFCNWTLSKIKEDEAKHPEAWDNEHIFGGRSQKWASTCKPEVLLVELELPHRL